ncbi:hypothetical protein F8568_001775 [Actinomadura sp. LD22]|uniref:Uncharacterized protein n=1 Tax=Actinomadura physcomitrii TaxID=2650748 RepID=A0A6I4MAI3_9ACTN|nr:hypothetical protein [Actinomadura physcomitrii]MVZ99135.1 hypothetical protein [Actinomadura physcomitrii]
MGVVTAVEHLERLAVELDAAGWTVGRRYDGTPLVRVSSAGAPHIGRPGRRISVGRGAAYRRQHKGEGRGGRGAMVRVVVR